MTQLTGPRLAARAAPILAFATGVGCGGSASQPDAGEFRDDAASAAPDGASADRDGAAGEGADGAPWPDARAPDAGADAAVADAALADAAAPDAAFPSCLVPTDYAMIEDALAEPSCDVIGVAPGTYQESLSISRSVEIARAGTGGDVVIDGGGESRVVTTAAGTVVRLRELRLENGRAPAGGGVLNGGELILEDVTVAGNEARTDRPRGGGIYNSGVLELRRSRIEKNAVTPTANTTASQGAGIYSDGESVSLLEGSVVTENGVGSDGEEPRQVEGAGIAIFQTELVLDDSHVTSNSARGLLIFGAGIRAAGGSVELKRGARVTDNIADVRPSGSSGGSGGGIDSQGALVSLRSGSSVARNEITADGIDALVGAGGAGVTIRSATLDVQDGSIEENTVALVAEDDGTATATGAGIQADQDAVVELGPGAVVRDNVGSAEVVEAPGVATARGGGVAIVSGSLSVHRARIEDNRIEAQTAAAPPNADAAGGGIDIRGAAASITESTIANNVAKAGGSPGATRTVSAQGGGLYVRASGDETVTVARSTLSGNVADGTRMATGGGVRLHVLASDEPELAIEQSTLSGNEVVGGGELAAGGGLYVETPSSTSGLDVFVSGSTIALNRVDDPDGSGGGLASAGSAADDGAELVHLRHTLIDDNVAATGGACATAAPTQIESVHYNLFETQADCSVSGEGMGDVVGDDPELGDLAEHGGPTKTHLIGEQAAAHDAGDPNACTDHAGQSFDVDQRGEARPVAACDIGAVERAP